VLHTQILFRDDARARLLDAAIREKLEELQPAGVE
jgi:hypothetical protein